MRLPDNARASRKEVRRAKICEALQEAKEAIAKAERESVTVIHDQLLQEIQRHIQHARIVITDDLS